MATIKSTTLNKVNTMKVISVSKTLKTRAQAGFHNHTAYVNGKELVIFDWATRLQDADTVLNDKRLRNQLVNEFGYDLDEENLTNMLIAVEKKTKTPYLVHSAELEGSLYDNRTEFEV